MREAEMVHAARMSKPDHDETLKGSSLERWGVSSAMAASPGSLLQTFYSGRCSRSTGERGFEVNCARFSLAPVHYLFLECFAGLRA